jgi:hypothetical protein
MRVSVGIFSVIRGLDPRIHAASVSRITMDCRVKPGNDAECWMPAFAGMTIRAFRRAGRR